MGKTNQLTRFKELFLQFVTIDNAIDQCNTVTKMRSFLQ